MKITMTKRIHRPNAGVRTSSRIPGPVDCSWRAQCAQCWWLLVLACVCGAATRGSVAGENSSSVIPLEKGTRWTYEAKVEWTPVAGSPDGPGIKAATLRWTTEVLECLRGSFATAAVVRAFPTEVLGMDPATPNGWKVLVATSNRVLSLQCENLAQATRLAREWTTRPVRRIEQKDVLLELPLRVDRRWIDADDDLAEPMLQREDGWYCWRVEAVQAQKLSVKGLPEDEYFTTYVVAYRTLPDHQVIELTSGVGITRLEYEHHGTVGRERVQLVEFRRGPPADRTGESGFQPDRKERR